MTKLRLSDWASIAEVVGAIAVVISLLYVGVQINANTAEVRSANRQELVNRSFTATSNAASSPELASALSKAADGAPLTRQELSQYEYFVRSMLYDVQEAYLLFIEGHLDESYWNTRAAIFEAYVANELAPDVYRRDKKLGVLHGDFVEWVDKITKE